MLLHNCIFFQETKEACFYFFYSVKPFVAKKEVNHIPIELLAETVDLSYDQKGFIKWIANRETEAIYCFEYYQNKESEVKAASDLDYSDIPEIQIATNVSPN